MVLLDELIDRDEDITLYGREELTDPQDLAIEGFESQKLLEALGHLNDRQQEVMRLRYGLDGGEGMTYEEIAERLGLTREAIRKIERKAFRRLKMMLGRSR